MRKYFVIAFSIVTVTAFAQRKDFQTWWSLGIEGQAFEKFSYGISPEVRLYNNTSSIKSILLELDVKYEAFNFFHVGGKYRLQERFYYNELNHIANRFGIYGQLRHNFNNLRIRYRAMYLWEYIGFNTREYGSIPFEEHRHRLTLRYFKKSWKIRPMIAGEAFFLRRPTFVLGEQKYMLKTGADYKITKRLSFGLFYRFQTEYYANNPWNVHILTSSLTFRI